MWRSALKKKAKRNTPSQRLALRAWRCWLFCFGRGGARLDQQTYCWLMKLAWRITTCATRTAVGGAVGSFSPALSPFSALLPPFSRLGQSRQACVVGAQPLQLRMNKNISSSNTPTTGAMRVGVGSGEGGVLIR